MKQPEFEPIVLRAAVAIPEIGVDPGDDVVIDPMAPRLFTVLKRLPDQGAIAAIRAGKLTPFGRLPSVERLVRLTKTPRPGALATADEFLKGLTERYCFIREPGRSDLPGREPPTPKSRRRVDP